MTGSCCRHAAVDLGATGPGRLTRGECNEVRLAKKGYKYGAVSEECPESGGLSRFHVERGFNEGRRNVR